jgi:hypothetical protein
MPPLIYAMRPALSRDNTKVQTFAAICKNETNVKSAIFSCDGNAF